MLAGAWQGGLAAGAVLGVTIGLSMDLAGSGVPLYAMAWGLAALAAGAFRGKKRVWAAAAFAAADGAAVLWTWDRGLTLAILYEVFLGSVAFFMVPERQWKRLGGLLAPAPTAPPDGRAQGYVQKKLEATAAAFVPCTSPCGAPSGCRRTTTMWRRSLTGRLSGVPDLLPPVQLLGAGLCDHLQRPQRRHGPHAGAGAGSGQRLPPLLRRPLPPLPRLCGGGEPGAHRPALPPAVQQPHPGEPGGGVPAVWGAVRPSGDGGGRAEPGADPGPGRQSEAEAAPGSAGTGDGDGSVPGRVRPSAGGAEGGGMPDSGHTGGVGRPIGSAGCAYPGGGGGGEPDSDPAGAADGGSGRGSPEEGRGDGERGRRDLLQAGGRHPLCAAVRRHGERARGGPGELPGCPACWSSS